MVKVRIEYDGQVREFEKDAVIAFFPDDGGVYQVLMGETNADEMTKALSAGIPRILEVASESRMEYVSTMIDAWNKIEEKIEEELRAGGVHPLVDALIKAMGEELER